MAALSQAEFDRELATDISQFIFDPTGFVNYVYPWGKRGTVLVDATGPDTWQTEEMNLIGRVMQNPDGASRFAVASGHGIGKTAQVAWIIHWFISTRPNPQIIVTANTRNQLLGKTWRELAKWHNMSMVSHWFNWTATRLAHSNDLRRATWFAQAVPWSESNSEAFAGTHERDVLVIMDEASAVADIIWEVVEGAMTTPGAMWLALGNPTRNTGRFRECFGDGRFAHRWHHSQIDSRDAKMADRTQIDQWIADYGEDSDFVRVRVKGQFPRASSAQFIASDVVTAAQKRRLISEDYDAEPILIGADVARFGDDETVITIRQGNKVLDQTNYRGLDTMEVARKVAAIWQETNAEIVFVDGVGLGAGTVDRLVEMNVPVIDVQGAAKPDEPMKYVNKRAECWGRMRDWFKRTVEIPRDVDLKSHLTSLEYGYNTKMQIQLEKKTDLKKRGLPSPDRGDSLALTFAEPVFAADETINFRSQHTGGEQSEDIGKIPRVSRNSWRLL